MFASRALFAFVFCGIVVQAASTFQRRASDVKTLGGATKFKPAGALYFMTNQPDDNFIVAAQLNADGTISFDSAVSTRGLGLHGINAPNSADGTFSQGTVEASSAGKVLAVVNPGSHTVSLFSINPRNPLQITQIGQPVSSEGEFPMALAFNKAGTRACVLNGGQVNGVNCFKVDKTKGLVAIPNSLRSLGIKQTTPPTGPPGTTSHLIFNEDDTKLIASVKGVPPTPGFFAVWDVAKDGSLSENHTKVAPPAGGMLPFSLNLIPGHNAILATDAGVGFEILDLTSIGKSSKSKGSVIPIKGQMATCWSTFSKKTGNFYLTDVGTSTVTEVHVDSELKGTIVKQFPQAAGSATIDSDIATLGGKDFMFILQAHATSVTVLAIEAPGRTKHVGTFDLAKVAKHAGLSIDPNNLQGMTTFVTQ